jgi:hypothetical protein
MGPNLTNLDVPHGFAFNRASRKYKTGVGHLGALQIPFKLGVGQWVIEECRAPRDEIILFRQPGDQSVEVFAAERNKLDPSLRGYRHEPIVHSARARRNQLSAVSNPS